MGLQCGSIRMSRLVQTFTILVLCLHLGAAYGSKSLVGTRAGGSNEGPSTLAEKEKDFLEWVQRVGDRQSLSATATPSTTSSEASESSWVQANELGGGSVITVSKSGGAQFTTIQAAVDFVPKKNSQRVVIQIAAGVYQEKVLVPKSKPYITFQGAGSGVTTITYGDTKADTGKTQDSATVGVNSDGFIAKGITFKNSAPAPPPGAVGRQAVAFKIAGDKAAFYECSFLGAQDTLYDDHGRHYFENCYIQGSIDFIFGDGQSLYQGCELHALSVNPGSLTAQKRSSPGESTGFSFVRCTVSGSGMLYLGRAWGPYSRVIFSYTYIADIIIPQGWFNWGVPDREKTVFYGQYKCSGPGANENGRVAWAHELTDAQAAPFQSVSFIDGASWLQS